MIKLKDRCGATMYSETIRRLEAFSDPNEFERFGCDLLSRLGYRGIEPQGVGRKDGGKDALHVTGDNTTVIHFSLREDWDKKLAEDLETTRKSGGKYTKFVFVSNRRIPPIKRDDFKRKIRSEYGWEPDIIDQECLRVELDNHCLDLRRKYLSIPEEHKTQINEIITEFVENRDEISSFLPKSRFRRILLLSIPNEIIDNRMKLYDDRMKFIADTEKLKSILGENLPAKDFESKITSNSFSTSHIRHPQINILTPTVSAPDKIYEANLYNNGIIEILFDAGFRIETGLVLLLLKGLFRTVERLYEGFINKDEYVTLAVCFINAKLIRYKKDNDKIYNGEDYYLYHVAEEKLNTVLKNEFQRYFAETLINKIDNFFNNTSTR